MIENPQACTKISKPLVHDVCRNIHDFLATAELLGLL